VRRAATARSPRRFFSRWRLFIQHVGDRAQAISKRGGNFRLCDLPETINGKQYSTRGVLVWIRPRVRLNLREVCRDYSPVMKKPGDEPGFPICNFPLG